MAGMSGLRVLATPNVAAASPPLPVRHDPARHNVAVLQHLARTPVYKEVVVVQDHGRDRLGSVVHRTLSTRRAHRLTESSIRSRASTPGFSTLRVRLTHGSVGNVARNRDAP